MKATTLPCLLTLLLVLALAPAAVFAAKPGLWWEVRLSDDGSQVEITVSTEELASDRTLTRATCQVAFLGKKGLLGTQQYAFPVPQEAGVEQTEAFSHVYGDQVISVTGPEMKYTLGDSESGGENGTEESGSIAARKGS